jgi:hypothetical protein
MGGFKAEAPPLYFRNNTWRSKNCEIIYDCAPAVQQTSRASETRDLASFSSYQELASHADLGR